jgi:hypothetical protein
MPVKAHVEKPGHPDQAGFFIVFLEIQTVPLEINLA